jgi:hypothetical protein
MTRVDGFVFQSMVVRGCTHRATGPCIVELNTKTKRKEKGTNIVVAHISLLADIVLLLKLIVGRL